MGVEKILFYCFSFALIFSAAMVVTSKNSVRAVLFLILSFVCCSGLWVLIQVEYLAIILILVYVGAVMVLFLFVVMFLDMNLSPVKEGFTRYMPVALLIGFCLVAQLIYVLGPGVFGAAHVSEPVTRAADYSNILALGNEIYVEYLLAFEIVAMILLVAMIAAVSLTFRGPKQRLRQNIASQVQVKKSDRLRIIND